MRLLLLVLASVCALGIAGAAEPQAPAEPKAGPQAEPKVETGAPPTGPLTVDEVMAEPVTWGPNLSPSGRYLALLSGTTSQGFITIADLQDEQAKPFLYKVPGGSANWVAWKSDDCLLYAKRGYTYTRVVSIDRAGKDIATMFTGNAVALQAYDLSRVTDFRVDDPEHVIMPAWRYQSLDLFRVNVNTGASERIAKGNPATFLWFTDRDGQPAFRVDHNWSNTRAFIYSRKGPGTVDSGDDLEWEKLLTISLQREDYRAQPDFYPYAPGPEPNTFYVVARPEGADTTGIYLYDFVAKKYLKTLASEPGIDIDDAFVDPHTHEYLGTRYYADRKVMRLVDKRHQAHLNGLDKYFGGEVDVYLPDSDRAHENWLLFTIGPRDRGSWHLYRVKDRFVRQVQHRFPVIDPGRLGTTRVVRYRARDGLEIMGYLTTPPVAPKDGPPPLIMYPHGGPEVRDYYEFDGIVQLLASRGYSVFQPNFRGSSGFGKKFADAGKRQWGRAMQDDLTDGFDYLVKQGLAAKGRACIVGFSYGGYAALAAAAFTPDLFRCAASISGVSDLPEQLEWDEDKLDDDEEIWDYVKKQIGDPKADADMLKAWSPARSAKAVRVPVLLIHGKRDQIVPFEQSELMDKALRAAGKEVVFIEHKLAGHTMYGSEAKHTYRAILTFLGQHLPVSDTQAAASPPPAN